LITVLPNAVEVPVELAFEMWREADSCRLRLDEYDD
jgi:hypothetical protein